jgi:hypothetical protein
MMPPFTLPRSAVREGAVYLTQDNMVANLLLRQLLKNGPLTAYLIRDFDTILSHRSWQLDVLSLKGRSCPKRVIDMSAYSLDLSNKVSSFLQL